MRLIAPEQARQNLSDKGRGPSALILTGFLEVRVYPAALGAQNMARRATMLVLASSASNRSRLSDVLTDLEGPVLIFAKTRDEASAFLAGVRFDLAFIEVESASNLGFIQGIRRGLYGPDRRLPIIAMASGPHTQLIASARDSGVNGFVANHFTHTSIALQLSRVRTDNRIFIEIEGYIGPDRRRLVDDTGYSGPERRAGRQDIIYVG